MWTDGYTIRQMVTDHNSAPCHFMTVSGYIAYGLSIGYLYGLGALFPNIMDTFNASRAETSTIQSVFAGILAAGGVLYGTITSRIGPIRTTISGSIVTSLGFVVSFWATSLPFLVVTTVVTAIGCGLRFVSCTVGIRQHFSGKAAVVVLAIVSSASGTTGVGLTYVLRFLSEIYGLRGTLLILGGVQLNCAVLSLLWRNPGEKDKRIIKSNTDNNRKDEENVIKQEPKNDGPVEIIGANKMSPDSQKLSSVELTEMKSNGQVNAAFEEGSDKSEESRQNWKNLNQPQLIYNESHGDDNGQKRDSQFYNPSDTAESTSNLSSTTSSVVSHKQGIKAKLKHILQLPSYMFTIVGYLLVARSIQVYSVFTLDMYTDWGYSNAEGSIGLSAMNFVAILGRVSPALLAHCPCYNTFLIPTVSFILASVAMILLTVAENIYFLFILSGVIGFALGVTTSVLVVTMSELVESQYLAEALGLVMSLNGIFALIVGPVTGFIRDSTGSYDVPQILSGSFSGLGCALFIIAAYFSRRQTRQEHTKTKSMHYVTKL